MRSSQYVFVGLQFLLAGFLLILLAACLPVSTPDVVKIGLIAPFEGPSRSLGYSVLWAVQVRVDQWNRAGNSPQVELVALNDEGDAALAMQLPAQLAADPDLLVALGPPQGHTARASLDQFAALDLPVLALAPLPDTHPSVVLSYAGTDSDLLAALAPFIAAEVVSWQQPLVEPAIWVGEPRTLVELVKTTPALVAAAGAVAAEGVFAAWAGSAAAGLTWASAQPDTVAEAFVAEYEALAGAPPSPMALLAYAAAGEALKLISEGRSRSEIAARFSDVNLPAIHVFQRGPDSCCQPVALP